jgi:hypothetical protein
MTGQPEYLDHNFAEEPTRMAPDFALDETVAISGESLQDLPPDFEDCSSVTPEEMREFTTKLQTTTEIGKFDEAIDAQDLFTAFVQLGVAYENKLENLFVMQQKFVELVGDS